MSDQISPYPTLRIRTVDEEDVGGGGGGGNNQSRPCVLSLSACTLIVRWMFADQPYTEVVSTYGE